MRILVPRQIFAACLPPLTRLGPSAFGLLLFLLFTLLYSLSSALFSLLSPLCYLLSLLALATRNSKHTHTHQSSTNKRYEQTNKQTNTQKTRLNTQPNAAGNTLKDPLRSYSIVKLGRYLIPNYMLRYYWNNYEETFENISRNDILIFFFIIFLILSWKSWDILTILFQYNLKKI